MNAITSQDRFDSYRQSVLAPDRAKALFSSMPAHVKPERFERNLAIALRQQPRLLECDPVLVFHEISKAAALGLLLDPQLGEAYLIAANDWKTRGIAPQLRVGYRGLIKLGRQSGEIEMIYSHEVCRNDEFHCVLGDEKRLKHIPNLMEDRGAVGAYYAVVKFKDGATDFEVMPLREIHTIRDRSDGWRAFREGKIKSTPWSTDEGEMAKKTVIRRLMKRLPQSPDLADALRIEDEADFRDMRDVTPPSSGLADRLQKGREHDALFAPQGGFSINTIGRELDGMRSEGVTSSRPAAALHLQPESERQAAAPAGANAGGGHVTESAAARSPHGEREESTGQAQTRGGTGGLSVASPSGEQPGTESQTSPRDASPATGEKEDEPDTAPSDPQSGSSSSPSMSRDQFVAYSMALARATKKTSLKTFGEQAGAVIVEALGGQPSATDIDVVRRIFALHEQRTDGKIEAGAISDEVDAILAQHFGEAE